MYTPTGKNRMLCQLRSRVVGYHHASARIAMNTIDLPHQGSRSQARPTGSTIRSLGTRMRRHALDLPRLSPSRPLGRNSSTSTSTTKANTSFH